MSDAGQRRKFAAWRSTSGKSSRPNGGDSVFEFECELECECMGGGGGGGGVAGNTCSTESAGKAVVP